MQFPPTSRSSRALIRRFTLFLRVTQELLAGIGVYKLPAMLLMFPEQDGMQPAEMDPNRRKPRDGEKVRA